MLGWMLWAALAGAPEVEVTLRGSPESMVRQRAVADRHELPAARSLADLEPMAERGALVAVRGGADYEVASWVHPYAIPQVHRFVLDLAADYRAACGERLVVTSLTRPLSEQPPNAHDLSVHPNGMAADFRVPRNPACREWIEAAFLAMEEAGVIDATRERSPPHYHVAIFPEAYVRFADAREPPEGATTAGGGGALPGDEGAVGEEASGTGAGTALLTTVLTFLAAAAVVAAAARWAARRAGRRGVSP